ncbi:MAG: GTP-dependent dephospho-CoA kinase family protein [Methanobacteriaceae archaeon]
MLILDKNLRHEFKKPLGDLYASFDEAVSKINPNSFLISVGDETTKNLIESGLKSDISIIDNLIQRKNSNYEFENHDNIFKNILRAENPPGTISTSLWETIELAINSGLGINNDSDTYKASDKNNNFLIVVNGEEDLAVLPCILMAPENTVLLYGQPNEGVVLVDAQKAKNKAKKFISKLDKITV